MSIERPAGSHRAGAPLSRREALCRMGNGFGMMAFASMVGRFARPSGSVDRTTMAASPCPNRTTNRRRNDYFPIYERGTVAGRQFLSKAALENIMGAAPGGIVATERKTGIFC